MDLSELDELPYDQQLLSNFAVFRVQTSNVDSNSEPQSSVCMVLVTWGFYYLQNPDINTADRIQFETGSKFQAVKRMMINITMKHNKHTTYYLIALDTTEL